MSIEGFKDNRLLRALVNIGLAQLMVLANTTCSNNSRSRSPDRTRHKVWSLLRFYDKD